MNFFMSLTSRIKQAQQRAALAEANSGLEDEMARVDQLDAMLNSTHSFEALLARKDDSLVLVLPVSNEATDPSFAYLLSEEVEKSLAHYKPVQTNANGFLAYELTKKRRGRFPRKFDLEVSGLQISLNIVGTDIELKQETERKRAFGRAIQRTTAEHPYIPDVKKDFEFEARFDSKAVPSGQRYNLIALSRATRQYFPGLEIPFSIKYGENEITTHVTCAPRDKPIGALAGAYISTRVGKLARDLNLRHHDMIKFRVADPGKVYEIV